MPYYIVGSARGSEMSLFELVANRVGAFLDIDCACGHPRDMHLHLREGSDCGTCGKFFCPRYWPSWSYLTSSKKDQRPSLRASLRTLVHNSRWKGE